MKSRLDMMISYFAYILDCLSVSRDIQNAGNCHECKNKECGYKPKPGQMVRYNCPFYEGVKKDTSRD